MNAIPRHQCLVYKGSPAQHLTSLAATMRNKLGENHRCLYLNSPPMVAGIGSYLAAAGVDVSLELARNSLILSSDRDHLVDGLFVPDAMLRTLNDAIDQALRDGYAGLWASGDMSWETGPTLDVAKLIAYERGLEDIFRRRPVLCGVCQYHADTLSHEIVSNGFSCHPAIFVNETLSRVNPHYLAPETHSEGSVNRQDSNAFVERLYSDQNAG